MRFGLSPRTCRGRSWWQRVGKVLLILGASLAMGVPLESWAVSRVEVRNLGLSRLGGRTMLTVILNQAANPQVSPFTGVDRAQLVVEFPQAQAGKLPARLAGDDTLVKNVRTEVSEAGVKIILEMFPDKPYTMTREIRPLPEGLAMFRLDLEAGASAAQPKRPPAAAMPEPQEPIVTKTPETAAPAPEQTAKAGPGEQAPTEAPAAPPPLPEPTEPPSVGVAPTGTFAELYQLMPQAKGLLEFLRGDGWRVVQAQSYDRPGMRFSRGFHLTNPRYPKLRIKIAHLPPNAPAAPYINIIDLSMEGLTGSVPDEYRTLKQWNFSKIKTKYEDIGDFFDEALKPLRVDIRRECERLALSHADFITKFLQQAVPQNPKLAEEAMTYIRKKVSPRFEGVQYTLSENPLVILNLVDFLYVRVYYISG
ncbi:MAG: hypothetical protein P8X58_10280 [Syntrophobacterales bacterium]|jgi:hypothetical protein